VTAHSHYVKIHIDMAYLPKCVSLMTGQRPFEVGLTSISVNLSRGKSAKKSGIFLASSRAL
jgi:hypothetical protein